MWFRDIEVPQGVVDAHRAGTLVLFVGAGASLDPPSDLPSFEGLVAEIATASPEPDIEVRRTDVALGKLKDLYGIDVHTLAHDLIAVSTSSPNPLHTALARLTLAGRTPRVVTTNFDRHLSHEIEAAGGALAEFVGPAVPLGDNFEGVVYLHGSVGGNPSALVLTDRDFGAAYLRDAWATRFLERMFSRYTVLFVGYSHHDVTMEYLAKGLRDDKGRFILTSEPDDPDWARLGVTPIGYMKNGTDHSALRIGLERWAELEAMKLLGHERRVARVLEAPPPLSLEDDSYLREVVADPKRVRFFTARSRGHEWLVWLSQSPEFRDLFRQVPNSSTGWELATWFAGNYVTVEAETSGALERLHALGGSIGPVLWSAIGHALHTAGGKRPVWLDPWVYVLIRDDPMTDSDLLAWALTKTTWPEGGSLAMEILDHLIEPRARLVGGWMSGPRVETFTLGKPYWIDEAWASQVKPNLSVYAAQILVMTERHIRTARILQHLGQVGDSQWDSDSYSRNAIESHPQDEHRDDLDPLIDIARDTIDWLFAEGEVVEGRVDSWLNGDVALLRRLAVHAWVERSDIDADTKLRWLLTRGLIFDVAAHHEVYRLIAVCSPAASGEAVDSLIAGAVEGPSDDQDSYERFSLLGWIAQSAPQSEPAQAAFRQVAEQHEDWAVRSHPDALIWHESGFVTPKPPMTSDSLDALVVTDPRKAIEALTPYLGVAWGADGPSQEDALELIRSYTTEHPERGLHLADGLRDGEEIFRAAIIAGWASAIELSPDLAGAVLDQLFDWRIGDPDAVARLLGGAQNEGATTTSWVAYPRAREIAVDLWSGLAADDGDLQTGDWLGRAINDPAGWLAFFWIRTVQHDWAEAGSSWSGIPSASRAALEGMLGSDGRACQLASVVIASQVGFLSAADRRWTSDHLLPLLDWVSHPTDAARNWTGFLTWGRWTEGLLADGLLIQYESAVQHADELPEQLRRQLAIHVAGVVLRAEAVTDRLAWARVITVRASQEFRSQWLEQLGRVLASAPDDEAEAQWQSWMRDYWSGRLRSNPRPLSPPEAAAIVRWILPLTASKNEAIGVALQTPAGIDSWGGLVRELRHADIEAEPRLNALLVTHLLSNSSEPIYVGHELQAFVQRLVGRVDDQTLGQLLESCVELGFSEAATWADAPATPPSPPVTPPDQDKADD